MKLGTGLATRLRCASLNFGIELKRGTEFEDRLVLVHVLLNLVVHRGGV